MDTQNSFPVKILVIGNSGVGKTSLCNRYLDDRFERAYKPTIGGRLKVFSSINED